MATSGDVPGRGNRPCVPRHRGGEGAVGEHARAQVGPAVSGRQWGMEDLATRRSAWTITNESQSCSVHWCLFLITLNPFSFSVYPVMKNLGQGGDLTRRTRKRTTCARV